MPACFFFLSPLSETSAHLWKTVEKAAEKCGLLKTQNNHFNCNGCVWGAAAAAGSAGLRWHRPPGRGRGAGTRLWAGLQGNYRAERRASEGAARQPPLPAVSPESCSRQLGELLSVSSLASGDNWRCSQCKHVFFLFFFSSLSPPFYSRSKLCSIVAGRGPETSGGRRAERRRREEEKKFFSSF